MASARSTLVRGLRGHAPPRAQSRRGQPRVLPRGVAPGRVPPRRARVRGDAPGPWRGPARPHPGAGSPRCGARPGRPIRWRRAGGPRGPGATRCRTCVTNRPGASSGTSPRSLTSDASASTRSRCARMAGAHSITRSESGRPARGVVPTGTADVGTSTAVAPASRPPAPCPGRRRPAHRRARRVPPRRHARSRRRPRGPHRARRRRPFPRAVRPRPGRRVPPALLGPRRPRLRVPGGGIRRVGAARPTRRPFGGDLGTALCPTDAPARALRDQASETRAGLVALGQQVTAAGLDARQRACGILGPPCARPHTPTGAPRGGLGRYSARVRGIQRLPGGVSCRAGGFAARECVTGLRVRLASRRGRRGALIGIARQLLTRVRQTLARQVGAPAQSLVRGRDPADELAVALARRQTFLHDRLGATEGSLSGRERMSGMLTCGSAARDLGRGRGLLPQGDGRETRRQPRAGRGDLEIQFGGPPRGAGLALSVAWRRVSSVARSRARCRRSATRASFASARRRRRVRPTPAASSITARRSLGRAVQTASTCPWRITARASGPSPNVPSASCTSRRRHLVVELVARLAAAGQPSGDLGLGPLVGIRLRRADRDAHLGHPRGRAPLAPREHHLGHPCRPQPGRALLAHRPDDRFGEVALTGPVGPDDHVDARSELEADRRRE